MSKHPTDHSRIIYASEELQKSISVCGSALKDRVRNELVMNECGKNEADGAWLV